jgi:hypothetical protein
MPDLLGKSPQRPSPARGLLLVVETVPPWVTYSVGGGTDEVGVRWSDVGGLGLDHRLVLDAGKDRSPEAQQAPTSRAVLRKRKRLISAS